MTPDPLEPTRCARMLGALAAPERLRIVRFLQGRERNVGEIADMLETPAVNVTYHLNVLKSAGLILSEKRGRYVYHSLAPGILEEDETTGNCGRLNLGCCRLELPESSPGEAGSATPA
jgi:DNA-binding transcriptional ArsR family regulator